MKTQGISALLERDFGYEVYKWLPKAGWFTIGLDSSVQREFPSLHSHIEPMLIDAAKAATAHLSRIGFRQMHSWVIFRDIGKIKNAITGNEDDVAGFAERHYFVLGLEDFLDATDKKRVLVHEWAHRWLDGSDKHRRAFFRKAYTRMVVREMANVVPRLNMQDRLIMVGASPTLGKRWDAAMANMPTIASVAAQYNGEERPMQWFFDRTLAIGLKHLKIPGTPAILGGFKTALAPKPTPQSREWCLEAQHQLMLLMSGEVLEEYVRRNIGLLAIELRAPRGEDMRGYMHKAVGVPTDYAMSNEDELWADSITHYFTCPAPLRRVVNAVISGTLGESVPIAMENTMTARINELPANQQNQARGALRDGMLVLWDGQEKLSCHPMDDRAGARLARTGWIRVTGEGMAETAQLIQEISTTICMPSTNIARATKPKNLTDRPERRKRLRKKAISPALTGLY